MKLPSPVILGPSDIVTKRCGESHVMQFVRDFGFGGQTICTPVVVDGVPLCSVCLSDEDLLRLVQAGCEVELDN